VVPKLHVLVEQRNQVLDNKQQVLRRLLQPNNPLRLLCLQAAVQPRAVYHPIPQLSHANKPCHQWAGYVC